jgi:hypothetical protein
MADKQNMKIVAIILAVVGVALIIWGYQMSGSVGNELTRTFTGSSSNDVVYRYVGGAACLAVGVFLFFKK